MQGWPGAPSQNDTSDAPSVAATMAAGGDAVLLIKPQFEVGREQVGKGGVVRDDALRRQACDGIQAFAEGLGYRQVGRSDCRIAGPKGNREIFLWLERIGLGADEEEESAAAV